MSPRLLLLGAGGFLGRSIAQHIAGSGDAELILHSRGTDDRAGFSADVESHSLDLLNCAPGAIADLIDSVAPTAVVNCTGLAVGDPDDMRSANVYAVSMGVYAVSRRMLRRYTPGLPLGFDTLIEDLLRRDQRPASYPFAGYWLDIGRPDDYDRANIEFEQIKSSLLRDL